MTSITVKHVMLVLIPAGIIYWMIRNDYGWLLLKILKFLVDLI